MKVAMISCDSHAGPRPSEYQHWLEPRYRDRVDELIAHMEWMKRHVWVAVPTAAAAKYVDTRGAIASGGLDGLWDPARRMVELEAEGFVAEVIFPGDVNSVGFYFSNMNRPYSAEYRAAGVRAYNRWLAEFCSFAPTRMIGVAQLEPWPDLDACVGEIERVRKSGLKVVALPRFTGIEANQPPLTSPAWEPVWKSCAENDLVVSVHIGHQYPQGFSEDKLEAADLKTNGFPDKADDGVIQFDPARRLLWQILLSGVFDRYPELKVTFTEIRTEWVAPMLAHLERHFDSPAFAQSSFAKPRLRPRDYWRAHCAVGGQLRPYEIQLRHETGIDQLMFGTDFPHAEGAWPNTRAWLRLALEGVPESEGRKILGENAARIYAVDLKSLAADVERVGPQYSELCGGLAPPRVLIDHLHWRSGLLGRPNKYDADALEPLLQEDESRIALTAA